MNTYMRKRDQLYSRGAAALGSIMLLLALLACAVRGCRLSKEQSGDTIRLLNAETGEVAEIDMEEYIASVVGAEMPASFPLEALKAQAVAARTYAIRRRENGGCGAGEVCTDSGCCQSYKTPEQLREKFGGDAALYMAKLKEAAQSTAGEYLTYRGEPIEALYHSSAGGRTEDAENVFCSAVPYLVSVESPGEEAAGKYAAEVTLSKAEFAERVNKKWPAAGLKKEKLTEQVRVISRTEGGRVQELRLGGATVSGRELRKLLELNSANFTISIGEEVTIRTLGYGHGVGMSQYGARAMALSGKGYEEILRHYYTGAELAR